MAMKMAVKTPAVTSRAAPRAPPPRSRLPGTPLSMLLLVFLNTVPRVGPCPPGAGYVSMGKPLLTVACSPRAWRLPGPSPPPPHLEDALPRP